MMQKCVFCDIAQFQHEIVLATSTARVIYNLKPVRPGHVMIVPIDHIETLADLPTDLAGHMLELIKDTYRLLEVAFKAEGFNVILQDGLVAGQSVPHLHVHVIPRRYKDMSNLRFYANVFRGFWHRPSLRADQMQLIVGSLRQLAARLYLGSRVGAFCQ